MTSNEVENETETVVKKENLPYGVEYAKTGRSSCKKCKEIIPQGHTRMAIRQPSQFFDGLQDNWHHYACFWRAIKSNPINERSIRGVDWLKWEDQQKIRESIKKHMETVDGGSSSGPTTTASNSLVQLAQAKVEYSKTNRGKCVACQGSIEQGVMKYGWKSKFYHFECFFVVTTEFQGEIDDLQGFQNMTETDQTMLRDAFEVIHQSTQLVKDAELAGDLQQREADENGPAKKRKKVTKTPDDLRDERLQKQADLLWQLRSGFAKWLSKDQWCRLLETNGLDVPQGGPDKILDLLTDAALFGRPLRCEKCLQGQLFYSTSSQTYLCTGHLSEWTKCTVAARKPKRLPFGVPKDLSAEIPWLIDEAPLNELSERYYNDKQEEIVSSKRTYRNRASTGGADLEAGDKIRGRADVGKAYIKKGTTVDAEFEKAAISHVCKDDEGNLYSAALVEADMATGRNSYYKLQLLKHDTANIFWVFRSWGRIGTTQGGIKTEEFRSMKAGVAGFEAVFLEKTQNEWRDRKYFRKKAGGMNWIETDTSDAANVEGNVIPGSKTDLPKPIVEIMKMIFDVSTMQAALKEYNIDTEKMPLGKLSKSQITKAYTVLQELLELISGKGAARKDEILDASNRFYTIIPHNTQLKMLDNPSVIKKKTAMLDSLLEIIEAFAMVKNNPNDEEENAERDPVDVNYEKLKTKMTVLDKSSAEYKLLVDYAKKTHGQTHKQLKVDIIDIIKIEREGEEAKFKKQVGNRMLLWHGSGTPNYGGILSQGLRIAPPEAPVSGYMFGKGVYFADMFSKSANYCRAHNGEGLLLLADVALGKIKEEPMSITHTAATMTKNKTNSCRGIGGTIPDPSTHVNDASGYVIPVGKPIARETTRDGKPQMPSLLYNEYIVYDVDQICLRYLVRGAFR